MQKVVLSRSGDYELRKCDPEDVPSVIEINARTLPEHYSDFFYHEVLAEFPEGFIVAEMKGEVVGYIMSRVEYGFSHLKKFGLARKGHVVSIAVLEEHRGKGVGTALLRAAEEAMAMRQANECYLEVRVTNTGAIALYERLGYKTSGRMESYYRDGEAAFLMAAPLNR